MRFDTIKTVIQNRAVINKNNLIHSLFFSFSIIFCTSPIKNLRIRKFDRQIGMGVLADYDISLLIKQFYIWIIAFAILFLLFTFFFCTLREKNQRTEAQKKVWFFLDDFSVIAFCALCFSSVCFFYNGITQGAEKHLIAICIFVYCACLVYIIFLSRNINPFSFRKLIITTFSFSCFMMYIIPSKFHPRHTFYAILLCTLFFFVLTSPLICKIKKIDCLNPFLDLFCSGCIFLPMLVSFSIEGIYILNQWSIFISHIKYFFIASFIILLVFSVFFAIIYNKHCKKNALWNIKWVYPILLAGIILCSNQPPLQAFFSPDIFESANYSILISDYLNFGKIPTIEHYGGHQLLNVISGIFYGIINNDSSGAIVSPYSEYFFPTICGVLFFFFLKEVTGDSIAFFTCLIIPYDFFYINYFAVGLFVPIAMIKYIKFPSIFHAINIWIAFVWVTISRLDLGVSMLGGAVFSLIFYCIQEGSQKKAKQLILSFILVSITCGLIWTVLCLIKRINPIIRLYEFLSISSSNASWAYSTLGDASKFGYIWAYCFIPLSITTLCLYSLISPNINKSKNTIFYLFLFSVFSYFANFPRMLVRHSFAEGGITTLRMILTAWFSLPLFIVLLTKKRRNFVPAIAILYFVRYLVFVGNTNYQMDGYFERFIKVADRKIETSAREKINRVILTEQSQEHYKPLLPILDALLTDNESFIDFTDTTFIYSVLGRECPVYVSQSPSMLSNNFSQNQFIKEIIDKKEKLPLALFPLSSYYLSQYIDNVPIVLRHYKVAEYLYQNYRPLCEAGDYAIWCDKEKYSMYQRHLKTPKSTAASSDTSMLITNNCDILKENNPDKFFSIISTKSDPFIDNLDTLIPPHIERDKTYIMRIEYESSLSGIAQLFISNKANQYSEATSIHKNVETSGKIDFIIELSTNTKLRFDIPDGSVFFIKNISFIPYDESFVSKIDYGYDDDKGFHWYSLNHLPYLWANKDVHRAKENHVISVINTHNDIYTLPELSKERNCGNYILIHKLKADTEGIVSIEFGNEKNNVFTSKYRFFFTVRPGEFDYLLRPSIDYYWYSGEINTMKIIVPGNENQIFSVSLLEGD